MRLYPNFGKLIGGMEEDLLYQSLPVHTEKWQGFDIKDLPEASMMEVINFDYQVPMQSEDLEFYRRSIQPNLPWADNHFEERMRGEPVNPGKTWLDWPWANKADSSRIFQPVEGNENSDGRCFSHTYMERYWISKLKNGGENLKGSRFEYGDLGDVISLLTDQPNTRQAFLPIFHPEDTGAKSGNRIPCTLGYYFIQRRGYLHIYYPIRSQDFTRHARDDLYLTVRLLLSVLDELRNRDPYWKDVKPGFLSGWVGSLHLFINDFNELRERRC